MSGKDCNRQRNRTISFRLSDSEVKTLEARIEASGIKKTDYYIHSCLYGRIVVVGSKENINRLIDELHEMELVLKLLLDEIQNGDLQSADEKIGKVKEDYIAMVKAIYVIAKESNASI